LPADPLTFGVALELAGGCGTAALGAGCASCGTSWFGAVGDGVAASSSWSLRSSCGRAPLR
jgi:hypothetical protein